RSRIVISAGALDLLDQAELAAVLAHERAHLRERHDLVLLPFTALLRAFRWCGVAREAHAAVALLVEMLADDRALRHRSARELATALLRVGAAGGSYAPAGALAVADAGTDGQVAARVSRLLRPAPKLPFVAVILVGVVAGATVAIPAAFLAFPFWASSGCGVNSRPRSVLVGDPDPQPAEALALVLDLGHLDPADLAGRSDMGAAVRLLVQADDVHDADILGILGDEVGCGADYVGDRERLGPGQYPHVDPPRGRDLGVAGGLDRVLEALGHHRQVKVHPGAERLHVPAGDQRPVVAEHDPAQHVQPGVGAHQRGAPLVLHRAADRGARRRDGV